MSFLRGLSLQSRLLAAIVLLTLASIAVIAWIGYTTTRDALTDSAMRELQSLQRTKTSAVRTMLTMTRNQVLRLSGGPDTARLAVGVIEAYRQLETAQVSESMREEVRRFYASEFEPALAAKSRIAPVAGSFLPSSNAGWYLQYHYIARGPKPYDGSGELAAPADASNYGELVRSAQSRLADGVKRLGLSNVLLVDPQTLEVVYSYTASSVLGSSLEDGPYAASNLADLVRGLRGSKDEDDYRLGDFEFYRPALGRPYAFLASPVFDGPRYVAIIVARLPLEPIADALSGNRGWRQEGLGETGETYLLGPDLTMRTDSRFLVENRDGLIERLRHSSLTERTVDDVERLGTTVLTVPVKHAAARAALNGESGVMRLDDYRGVPVFMAYGPLDLDSLRWGVISKIDVAEALQPLREYTRRVLTATVLLALLASLAALWLARHFTGPVADLVHGARRVSSGEFDTEVPLARASEYRELGQAFNDMVRNLRSSRVELDRQVQETERLLMSLLPASAAAQVREGRQDERRAFADVTVAYVSLHGLAGPNGDDNSAASMNLMSELVAAFDEAAEHLDVEKVRTIGSSYLAASGLSVQRPDHTARMVEFAREVVRIVGRFNAERGFSVVAEVGINAGPVTGGLVGRRRFIYDLWGDTVKLARGIGSDGRTSIQVTRAVYDRVRDTVSFGPPQRHEVPGVGTIELYAVIEDGEA